MSPSNQALIILGSTLVAFILGQYLGRAVKMNDYGWKIGVILASIAMAVSLCSLRSPKLGIDLSGGVILIYEVNEELTMANAESASGEAIEDTRIDMSALIQALQRRINPGGQKELVIRPYGERQVEIIIPKVSRAEVERIKGMITKSGFLKFRIVADKTRNQREWALGERALASDDPRQRAARQIRDGGEVVAEWVRMAKDEKTGEYKMEEVGMLTRELEAGEMEALAIVDDPRFSVEGRHLRGVAASFDQSARPCVTFRMTTEGAGLFGGLTSSNLPDKQTGSYARLGIVMDEELLSAPRIMSTISGNGEITGSFTEEEVDFLVSILRAGKLPAVLHEEPISEYAISPLLGEDTIRKGKFAISGSLVAILVFMVIYYHFAGIVSCLALIVNLVAIVGMMILIKGAFTLPGLAGLVLTVGMSVDANVLIFERIREELRRGTTLRMAIRNGFGRATTTIVDAQLTTLITAVVLYAIGTDQIRGFATTLILGIVMSMYTAIFCSRVIFDIAERRKWISKLSMLHLITETNINFIGVRKLAAAFSIVIVLVSVVAMGARGKGIFDIDFLGGTSVQAMLNSPIPIEQIRTRVADIAGDVTVTQVNPEGQAPDTVYKIDTSITDENQLEQEVQKAFLGDDGQSLLVSHTLTFSPPLAISSDGSAESDAADSAENEPAADETASDEEPADDAKPTAEETAATEDGGDSTEDEPEDDRETFSYVSQSDLAFDEKITKTTLEEMISQAATALELEAPRVAIDNPDWNQGSDAGFEKWTVQFSSRADETAGILERLQSDLSQTPAWLSSSKIGSKVAENMRTTAVASIVVALVGIVAYIWIRFQRVVFGLAAVLALVHDVSVTLGAIAISMWVSQAFGFLLVDEFKISLPIVAALLTIIGYSLNDTIVVFDRIREVKGKSPDLTAEMLNVSINQTLSRTLLTSTTTLLVVLILYIFGGQGIHSFAFALLIGVIVGTYSSIFVASPALLWMASGKASKPVSTKKQQPVTASE